MMVQGEFNEKGLANGRVIKIGKTGVRISHYSNGELHGKQMSITVFGTVARYKWKKGVMTSCDYYDLVGNKFK